MEQLLLIDSLVNSHARFAYIDGSINGDILSSFRQYYRYSGQASYLWNRNESFIRLGAEHIAIPRTARITDALYFIHTCPHFGIFILPDIQQHDLNDTVIQVLRGLMSDPLSRQKKMIMIGEKIVFPEWLEPAIARLRTDMFIAETTVLDQDNSEFTNGFPLLY